MQQTYVDQCILKIAWLFISAWSDHIYNRFLSIPKIYVPLHFAYENKLVLLYIFHTSLNRN